VTRLSQKSFCDPSLLIKPVKKSKVLINRKVYRGCTPLVALSRFLNFNQIELDLSLSSELFKASSMQAVVSISKVARVECIQLA